MLYACDARWFAAHRGAPDFAGVKVCRQEDACLRYPEIRHVTARTKPRSDRIETAQPGVIGWGGNGGFQAVNLAAQFGAAVIILVGFDMTVAHGTHWHPDHTGRLSNPDAANAEGWRRRLDAVAPTLRALGISVINASPISALTAYPKMTFEAALEYADAATGAKAA